VAADVAPEPNGEEAEEVADGVHGGNLSRSGWSARGKLREVKNKSEAEQRKGLAT